MKLSHFTLSWNQILWWRKAATLKWPGKGSDDMWSSDQMFFKHKYQTAGFAFGKLSGKNNLLLPVHMEYGFTLCSPMSKSCPTELSRWVCSVQSWLTNSILLQLCSGVFSPCVTVPHVSPFMSMHQTATSAREQRFGINYLQHYSPLRSSLSDLFHVWAISYLVNVLNIRTKKQPYFLIAASGHRLCFLS